ncbi:cell division protein FtsK [Morganella morganii]|nr:cell division protein FtsK [Morganella morganii]
MSQEYTEDKHIKFRKISSGRRLLEAVLIVIGLCAVFLLVALLSFNPSDPSWSQTNWHEPVKNLAGSIGAWFADILFFRLWHTGLHRSPADDPGVLVSLPQ